MYKEYLFEQLRWLWESVIACLVVSLPLAPLSKNTSGITLVMKM